MKLINWVPNNTFDLFDEINYYLNNTLDNDVCIKPRIRISDDNENYLLSVSMPGVDKKDIDITLDDGIINIKAEKSNIDNISYSEFDNYNYSRSFYAPDDAELSKIKAKSKNGILFLEIPKVKENKRNIKKIAIS